METARRGNYDSGDDFVLEYGELRFTFNERDFGERCEQAALKLGFVVTGAEAEEGYGYGYGYGYEYTSRPPEPAKEPLS